MPENTGVFYLHGSLDMKRLIGINSTLDET